jgi:hypothetical protein
MEGMICPGPTDGQSIVAPHDGGKARMLNLEGMRDKLYRFQDQRFV